MKISVNLLKKFLKIDQFQTNEISEKLTSAGLEVEEVSKFSSISDKFIIGQITSFEKHPNAEKLNVCKVSIGFETLQIVCGAENVRSEMKVIVAMVGAIVPNGNFEIKKATLRGVDSNGMMCSFEELNLGIKCTGIADMPVDFEVGKKLIEYFDLSDEIIDISITPDRGDCSSVYGVARCLKNCNFGSDFQNINLDSKVEKNRENLIDFVENENKILLAKIENISIKASNLNRQIDLLKLNINPKNYIVDLTNYIMMAFGQPMHAYDADKIVGKISVKKLQSTTIFTDLKNSQHILEYGDLVVCDEEKIIALAGIIGSQSSMIDENTKNIIIEAANFEIDSIVKTGQRLKIVSDARFRFERGVDPRLTDFAINFTINEISQNYPSSQLTSIDCANLQSDKAIIIDYNAYLIKKLCGVDIEAEKQISALKNAGYSIEQKSESSIKITPPKYRYDIKNSKDIAFDLMKMLNISHFENLPLSFQHSLKTSTTKNTETINKIKLKIASQGYNEVITLPFQDENLVKITESGEFVEIANPISSNAKTMRKSIITGLFDRFQENFHLTKDCLNIFEVGSVFLNNETISKNIGFLSSDVFSDQSYKTSKNSSIEQIKNDFLSIIKDVFNIADISYCTMVENFVHKFRSFNVINNGVEIGKFGQFSDSFLKDFKINRNVFFAEIFNIDNISIVKKIKISDDSNQPITRDFAFWVEKTIKIGDILGALKVTDNSIDSVELKDIYSPKDDNHGQISLSFSIKIKNNQDNSVAENISTKIIEMIVKKFNGSLRDGI